MIDVDAMLDSLEPGLLDEWTAYRRIEPDVAELLRRLLETVKLGISAICATQGAELPPEYFDFAPPDEQAASKPPEPEMSPAQGAAAMAIYAGAANRK